MSNGKSGRGVSLATWQKGWGAFDALPREVKAVCWDAMDRWATRDVVKAMNAAGNGRANAAAVNSVLAWDSHVLGERKPWLLKGQMRVGMSKEEMPASPHRRAEATVLRSHIDEYRHLILPRRAGLA